MTKKNLMKTTELNAVQPEETTSLEWGRRIFSPDELRELGQTLAQKGVEKAKLEADKKQLVSQFGSDIKKVEAEIGDLVQKITSGHEMVRFPCFVFREFATKTVFYCIKLEDGDQDDAAIYREDPDGTRWKIVRERRMKPEELQRKIEDGIAGAAGGKEKASA